MSAIINIVLTALIILIFNIPFGYWRANVNSFTFQWFLAIHLPVPFVVLMRQVMHTGWHWSTFAVFILAFFSGQLLGGYIYKKMSIKHPANFSSCIFMDMIRNC